MSGAQTLETDYLVVGSGAMGMAFVDELLARRPKERIVLVDRRAKPGGHWNDAYSFVSLHQPAAFYGVNSEKLGTGGAALATGTEVLAYYERVLAKLLGTGQVRYFPMCEVRSNGEFHSRIAPDTSYLVSVRRKTVDSTYMNVEVPATTPPRYRIAPEVTVVPPNDLPRVDEPRSGYVIIGAGKTGMDAVLFLTGQGVDPEAITWVMSNDAWYLDRGFLEPGQTLRWFVDQLEHFAEAGSLEELLLESEAAHHLMRLDPEVWPTKFRCATVNREEVAQLRSVENVVRLGRVKRIEPERIVLEQGEIPTDSGKLHVDCTANGLARREVRPVFDGERITLQSLFLCQQVFSAALIAYVETRFRDDNKKNALCQVVPHPERNRDYVAAMARSNANFDAWGREIGGWLKKSRLSLAHHEPMLGLIHNTFRAKRIGPRATRAMKKLFVQEFPGESFPVGH